MTGIRGLIAALVLAAGAAQAGEPTKLFAADEVIAISISAPWRDVARLDPDAPGLPGVLKVGAETLPVTIGTRGKSRRRKEVCDFPPLRVTFVPKPPQTSLFHKQDKLKLVSYCRRASSHTQLVLKEFAAYRLLNLVTPASFRARLADVSYVDAADGKVDLTRRGFFIEDVDDLADRIDAKEIERNELAIAMYEKEAVARAAVFQYMIGNLDWDMTAGPAGEPCCHNMKIVGPTAAATANLQPVPYDFDMSGLVDAPYSAPPEQIKITSVRTRVFRGACSHNAETKAAATELRAMRSELEAQIAGIPGLSSSTAKKATKYLGGFFKAVKDDAAIAKNLTSKCRGV